MKKRQIIFLLGLVLLCAVVMGYWPSCSAGAPFLTFKGYEEKKNDGARIARFELRNVTGRSIYTMSWFCIPEFLGDKYLVRTVVKDGTKTHLGPSVFMVGKLPPAGPGPGQVIPRGTNQIKIILPVGSGPEQIGIYYYTGDYTNEWDFAYSLGKSALSSKASWLEWKQHFGSNLKDWLRGPRKHEVWCSEILQP